MEEYVCVHDFGIAEDAAANGYELEWWQAHSEAMMYQNRSIDVAPTS